MEVKKDIMMKEPEDGERIYFFLKHPEGSA